MQRNEDGEFELVVGNTQLLSIVFVLMALFGIVFALGYAVGTNTGSGAPVQIAPSAANQPPGHPQAAGGDNSAQPQATPDDSLPPGDARVTVPETYSETPAAEPAASPVTATTPPPPVATPKRAVAAPAAPLRAAAPPATPQHTPAPPANPPRTAPPSAGPQPGQTFLQVAAVKKPQAEMLAGVLKDKGFHALTASTAPGSELYRTLVGPLRDASEVARTKTDLEKAGFKPIVKRY